jgi:hypothetical protein
MPPPPFPPDLSPDRAHAAGAAHEGNHMTTIDKISQVLSSHAKNEIDEAEALRRVQEITCGSALAPQMLYIMIGHAKTEVDRQRRLVRNHVESIEQDAQRMAKELDERGPDSVSTTWIAMHLGGLVESKTRLDAARDRVQELERLKAL